MTGNMMIATILQRDPQSLRECIAMWRQLSDIVAQRGMQLNQSEIQQSLRTLARLRNKVPEQVRSDTALSVAHHGRFAPLVALYANDTVLVAAAMLQNAHLSADDWLALLPATNDVARSILAGRDDLPSIVQRALHSLGAGAVALPVTDGVGEVGDLPAHSVNPVYPAAPALGTSSDTPPPTTAFFADEQAILQRQRTAQSIYAAANAETVTRPAIPQPRATERRIHNIDTDSDVLNVMSQISELVRRIDRFQSARSEAPAHGNAGKAQKKASATPAPNPVPTIAPSAAPQGGSLAVTKSAPDPRISDDSLSAIKAINADIRAKLARATNAPVARAPADSRIAPTEAPPEPVAMVPERVLPAPSEFRFFTNSDGVIDYVEGVPPPLIIGMSIASAALGIAPGTDGAAAGAFRQQAEIVHAHMRLGGMSDASGEWRFSAEPIFDRRTGQFQGYHAIARRPLQREKPYGATDQPEASDSIRQLIHELRSPLNAISGFAQIISGQMFGPVRDSYRSMADSIIEDAATVQAIIEDLDTAAGHMVARQPSTPDNHDVADIQDVVDYVTADLQPLLAEQRIGLSITQEGGPFLARIDISNARRMIGRLLTALVDISESDSLIVGQLIADLTGGDMMQLRIVRPSTIRFTDAAQLLDPGFSPDGEAPAADILSLGFSLRLVGSLANNSGGELEIASSAIILHLPLATSDVHQDKAMKGS